jgi:hypothetical protein
MVQQYGLSELVGRRFFQTAGNTSILQIVSRLDSMQVPPDHRNRRGCFNSES